MSLFPGCFMAGALVLATAAGCDSGDDEKGETGGAGGANESGGSSGCAGWSGTGGASAGAGGGNAGGSVGGSAGTGGVAGVGGSGGEACGDCPAPDQICVYQIGGPGPSHFVCATQLACGAAGECACIVGQGTCDLFRSPSGYCNCDNGLE